ncbi:MAG: helix-turn-helix transcriptional regulator [Bacteroidota bacterium]|nr:helix-turn-helix transcriptional regulator [Bacteroidota bacterium]
MKKEYNDSNQKLKALREEKGLSQQVADALHTGQAVISNIENGKAGLDVEILLKFAGFYNVEPQQLLTDNSLVMNFHEKV